MLVCVSCVLQMLAKHLPAKRSLPATLPEDHEEFVPQCYDPIRHGEIGESEEPGRGNEAYQEDDGDDYHHHHHHHHHHGGPPCAQQ